MRVCLGQINTTPGDFEGNYSRIVKGIDSAKGSADLIVFPELSIPGYLSQDLMYTPTYVAANLAHLEKLANYSRQHAPGLYVVVGYIDRNPGPGKPFFNMAAVIHEGKVVAKYRKQLIPFYDVFDELRYFEPGNDIAIVEVNGLSVGIAICEDLWNDKGSDDYDYPDNPMEAYRRAGVDLVVSLNSSPFIHDKPKQRVKMISASSEPDLTVVYVNQCGGQDELVFDGHSFVVRGGQLLHMVGDPFVDSFEVVDLETVSDGVEAITASLFDLLVVCLRDYVHKSGFKEIVFGSSGGVDSALVGLLASAAVGADKVHAIRMPSIYSSQHARDDAVLLHRNLGCWDYEIPIDHLPVIKMLNARSRVHSKSDQNLVSRIQKLNSYNNVADENMQARLRDIYLMHFSNAYGAMPLSTGNKTESACGYYTHFDMNFGFAPIKDLYKFEVISLVQENDLVPPNIWKKPPSAELSPGQIDEESLLPYAFLDPIVKAHIEDYVSTLTGFATWVGDKLHVGEPITMDPERLKEWLARDNIDGDYARIVNMMGRMEYKRRQTCLGTKVSKVAFGIGRRVPVVEKWY